MGEKPVPRGEAGAFENLVKLHIEDVFAFVMEDDFCLSRFSAAGGPPCCGIPFRRGHVSWGFQLMLEGSWSAERVGDLELSCGHAQPSVFSWRAGVTASGCRGPRAHT